MEIKANQNDIDQKMDAIIAENEGYSAIDPSAEEQEKYLGGYSFSALFCSSIYYWSMNDKVLFWVSLVSLFLFFPVILILPFFARRRAWVTREWRSFNHFQSVQKKWDKLSVYGLVASIFIFYFLVSYEIKTFSGMLNINGITNMNDVNKLQQDLQDL